MSCLLEPCTLDKAADLGGRRTDSTGAAKPESSQQLCKIAQHSCHPFTSTLLEVHVVNEEQGPQQDSLDTDVQVHGEVYAEMIRIREGLRQQSAPLLAHLAHFGGAVFREHLEVDVCATFARAEEGTLDAEQALPSLIFNPVLWGANAPLLDHTANDGPWGSAHFQSLQAAEATAIFTAKPPVEVNDFVAGIVQNLNVERTRGPAAVARAAVGIFLCTIHLLSKAILDDVLVLRLTAQENLQQFLLLVYQQLVDHGQVLEAGRYPRNTRLVRDNMGIA